MRHHPAARRWWSGRSPAAGGAAMATAVVSVGLRLAGHDTASAVLLVVALVVWLLLAKLVTASAPDGPPRWAVPAHAAAGTSRGSGG